MVILIVKFIIRVDGNEMLSCFKYGKFQMSYRPRLAGAGNAGPSGVT